MTRTPEHHCPTCEVSWRGLACWRCGHPMRPGPIPNTTRTITTRMHYTPADELEVWADD